MKIYTLIFNMIGGSKWVFTRIRRKIYSRLIIIKAKIFSNSNNYEVVRIYFDPSPPDNSNYLMWKIIRILRLNQVSAANRPQLAFSFNDETFSCPPKRDLSAVFVINAKCYDISKETVSENFAKIFGYELLVDPLSHVGACVVKSNRNAAHDGRVIVCPIDRREPQMCYQRIVNNEDADHVVDYRVVVVKSEIPLVYTKRRLKDERFANINRKVEAHSADKIFSVAEVEKIIKFCGEMGLDFGEIDVLRDRDNCNIYIVDVNKTPYGPPAELGIFASYDACMQISSAFQRQFLTKLSL